MAERAVTRETLTIAVRRLVAQPNTGKPVLETRGLVRDRARRNLRLLLQRGDRLRRRDRPSRPEPSPPSRSQTRQNRRAAAQLRPLMIRKMNHEFVNYKHSQFIVQRVRPPLDPIVHGAGGG